MATAAHPPEAQGEATLLFVYGTLKRGQANHGRLLGARWLGEAVLKGACLYDLGPFPMAVAGDGEVGGELYGVAWTALPGLDAFEGCPRLYQRHWLPLADGRQAWAYLGQAWQVRHSRRLPEGSWPGAAPTLDAPGRQVWSWRQSRGPARVESAVELYDPGELRRVWGLQRG